MTLKLRKRLSTLLLVSAAIMVTLSGCGQSKDESLSVMIPLQKESFKNFFDKVSELNTDIKFNLSAYRGGSPSAYIYKCFEANDLSDIVISSYPPEGEIQKETMLNLSGYNFVKNYKTSVLSNLEVDGGIYFLECPSSVRGIAYNKTIFSEKGWKVPTSHQEFIDLIKTIKQDNTYVPLGIQGKYPGTYFTLMSELSHCDFLQTPAGAEWMQKFAKGEAKSEEGFKYGINLLKDWVDAGAFIDEQLALGDSTLYEDFVKERWCAMSYIMGSQNKLVELVEASNDEFGVFPIYGEGEDSEFVATTYGLKVGLNKRLGEKGNEKKLKKALKVMQFLSTEEGQMIFHTGRGDILPLVGSSSVISPMFNGILSVIERGHCAPYLYPGYEDILASTGSFLRKACYDNSSLDGAYAEMDELRENSLANKSNFVVTVEETLDEDQVAQYVANALQAQGYGDFALISQGKYTEHFDLAGGANGKLYKGGYTSMDVNIPISNLGAQKAVVMSLTGSEVKTLLETGRILKDEEGHTDSYAYYSAGIDVTYNKEGTVSLITYKGAPLEDNTEYKVAFSPQDYSEETAALGSPVAVANTWETDYLAYIEKLGVIKPEHAVK